MQTVKVRLLENELKVAAYVGTQRQEGSKDLPDKVFSPDNPLLNHIQSASAEMAAAKYFGRYWPGIGEYKECDIPSNIEVRSSTYYPYFVLRPYQIKLDCCYVKVMVRNWGQFFRSNVYFELMGWITGKGMVEGGDPKTGGGKYWLDPFPGKLKKKPAWRIPDEKLKSMASWWNQ